MNNRNNITAINKQHRAFFFTLDAHEDNGMPSVSADAIRAVLDNRDEITDYVFQLERGHESTDEHPDGFLHYQGCFFLGRDYKRRIREVHKWFDDTLDWIHLEGQRRSDIAMTHYCSKDDTRQAGPFWSSDEFMKRMNRKPSASQQGQRSDLKSLADALDDGMTPDEIILDDNLGLLMNTTGQAFVSKRYAAMMKSKYSHHDRSDIRVHYLFGDAGSGKSRYVHEQADYKHLYTARMNMRDPFNNYDYEPILLLDEFRSQVSYSDLLQMLDRYVFEIDRRYENSWAAWTDVWIVSNWPLVKQYPTFEGYDDRKPLYRRIHDVYELNTGHEIMRLGSGLEVLDSEYNRGILHPSPVVSHETDDDYFNDGGDNLLDEPLPDESLWA